MKIGPEATSQLNRLAREWKQGEHVLVTGGTGSGKTLLARQLDEIRLRRGGAVVVFICKLRPDDTITEHYSKADGWVRWTKWKKFPKSSENKILLWPKVEGKTVTEATSIMQREFHHALSEISRKGKWTVHIDEGLFMSSPHHLGLGNMLGMMSSLMRSSKATLVFLAQRPAHMPVAIYANLSHAFVGRASETQDIKRLADLNSTMSSREVAGMIQQNGKHDFTWIPVGTGEPPERLNLSE